MNIDDVYLKFVHSEGYMILVSISSILDSGYPIDSETGDDMDLCDRKLYDSEFNPIQK